jgi:ABC-type sugar transport system substrate-binding protein
VGASDYQLGLQTARDLLKSLGGKGDVIILEGVRGTSTSEERMRGFHDALKETPGVKVLSPQPGNYQRMQALQVTENLLQTYPKIDGILAANDAMAVGAIGNLVENRDRDSRELSTFRCRTGKVNLSDMDRSCRPVRRCSLRSLLRGAVI